MKDAPEKETKDARGDDEQRLAAISKRVLKMPPAPHKSNQPSQAQERRARQRKK